MAASMTSIEAYLPALRALQIEEDYHPLILNHLGAYAHMRFHRRNKRHQSSASSNNHELRGLALSWLKFGHGSKFWTGSHRYLIVYTITDMYGNESAGPFLRADRDLAEIRSGVLELLKIMKAEFAARGALALSFGDDTTMEETDDEDEEEEEQAPAAPSQPSRPQTDTTEGTMVFEIPVRTKDGLSDDTKGGDPSAGRYPALAIRRKE